MNEKNHDHDNCEPLSFAPDWEKGKKGEPEFADVSILLESVATGLTNSRMQPGPYLGAFPTLVIHGATPEGEHTCSVEMTDKGAVMVTLEALLGMLLPQQQVQHLMAVITQLASENQMPEIVSRALEAMQENPAMRASFEQISVISDPEEVGGATVLFNPTAYAPETVKKYPEILQHADKDGLIKIPVEHASEVLTKLAEMFGDEASQEFFSEVLRRQEDNRMFRLLMEQLERDDTA